jgi:hypothetical protein
MKSDLVLVLRVWVLIVDCIFDTSGRIAADAMAKNTIVQMDVLLIKSKPHFSWVNCATFPVSTIRKGNILVTERVLHKVKHMVCNPDPTTGTTGAFKVTALTDALNNEHVITTLHTTIAVSQQKVGHG